MRARTISAVEYDLEQLAPLSSPRLVVYATRVEENISLMRRYLESIVPGSGFQHLAPHVKTHKSAWATSLLLRSGIRRFKCTLNEVALLLQSGAPDIFVAYPMLATDAHRWAQWVVQYRERTLCAQVGNPRHADFLSQAGRANGVPLDCLIDLDVGYRRTGIAPDQASDLMRYISRLGNVRVKGLHAYAGHNASPDLEERAKCSREAMEQVVRALRGVRSAGGTVERIVVGGTPGFLGELQELVVRHRVDAEVLASPGTWVYWDGFYDGIVPGMFEFAALLLAQVIDLPRGDLVTLNIGSKRWSVDKGPIEILSCPGLEVVSTSEEHTVFRNPLRERIGIGDRVLAAPQHICPTVNLWETFTLLGDAGQMEELPVTGRNR